MVNPKIKDIIVVIATRACELPRDDDQWSSKISVSQLIQEFI